MFWIGLISIISIGCGSVVSEDVDASGMAGVTGNAGMSGNAGTSAEIMDSGTAGTTVDSGTLPEVHPIPTVDPIKANLVGYYSGQGIKSYVQLRFQIDTSNFDKRNFTGTYFVNSRMFVDTGTWELLQDKLTITLMNVPEIINTTIIIKPDNTVVVPGYMKL